MEREGSGEVRKVMRNLFQVISGSNSKDQAKERLAFWIRWQLDEREGKKAN